MSPRKYRRVPPLECHDLRAFPHVQVAIAACSSGFAAFLLALFEERPLIKVSPRLNRGFGISSCALNSRFYRAGLPTPKAYAIWALIMRARAAYATGLYSVADIALAFGASSPQSFNRTIRVATGVSSSEYLSANPDQTVETFLGLIAPHARVLATFDPYAPIVRAVRL